MTAADLPGMAFPPVNVEKIEGMGLYTRQPQVADQMQRGEFTGKRIETISYVCEQEGSFTVPEITIQWWTPKKESLQNMVLETVLLKVDTNLLLQKENPANAKDSKATGFPWRWPLVILLFSCLAGAIQPPKYTT